MIRYRCNTDFGRLIVVCTIFSIKHFIYTKLKIKKEKEKAAVIRTKIKTRFYSLTKKLSCFDWKLKYFSLHENKNFRLTKICEKDRKDHIFISFRMFSFHGNIIFSELSLKRKCKKAVSFRKCVFLHKYEILVYDNLA